MVYANNAKDKTSGTRRSEEASGNSYNANRSRGSGRSSQAPWHQPLGDDRTDWERGDSTQCGGGRSAGKIIDELIEEVAQQLDRHLDQVDKLSNRLNDLRALAQQVKPKPD